MLLAHWLRAMRSRSRFATGSRREPQGFWPSRTRPARRKALAGRYRDLECWSVETLEDRTLLSATATDAPTFEVQDLTTQTADDLAQTLVGSGVQISNVQYTGSDVAAGTFVGGNTQDIGIEQGIILSTGNVADVAGPNGSDNTSTNLQEPGDADLDEIVGQGSTKDAAVLEFNFVSDDDFVTFTYVFASEEYNEFDHSEFNDAFAFFVNGENVALVPGTETPVSITTINASTNSQYFNNNDPSDLGTPTPFNTEFDGFTTVMTVTVPVAPGEVNHVKFVIADTSDPHLDSAVFIAAESFTSARADLSANMTDTPDPALVGQPLRYEVTVANAGPNAATDVVLTDTLPLGMSVQSVTIQRLPAEGGTAGGDVGASTTIGSSAEPAEFVVEDGVLTVELGDLEPGESAVVTITVVPSIAGFFTNTATVSSNQVDPDDENNTASQVTLVQEPGSISGQKYHDLNADGRQSSGEGGLAGFTIVVYDQEGRLVQTAVTGTDDPKTELDETGAYIINGLLPGTYTVVEVQQPGWEQSAPASGGHVVTVDSGATISDVDFGNFQYATVEGLKFHDLNANGVRDEGEPGLAGFTIEVLQDGKVVGTAVTRSDNPGTEIDEAGTYMIVGLLPGTYVVREVARPGYRQSFPGDGDGTYTISLDSGETSAELAFGNFQFYSATEDTTLDVDAAGGVLGGNAGATAALVDGPANGVLTRNADGSFTYVPAANFNGSDSFTYQVGSIVATVVIAVQGVNDPPVAAHDSYRADAGGVLEVPVELGLLSNDVDVDGDELSVELLSGPSNGTLELNPDGSFSYTPDEGFTSGVDTFTYRTTDSELNSQEVTVAINVNDPAFNDFADEVDRIVRDTLAANGLDPETKELGDEAVNQQINAQILVAYEEFLANYEGDEDFSNVVIVWLDPADFVLTDSEGRSSGFTEGQGQQNGIGDTFYSGNGDVEVMIIANAGTNPYQLEVSGTGSARGGANFITPDGVNSVTFQGELSPGETLVVALDPAEAAGGAGGGLDVADGGGPGGGGVAVGIGGADLALADDAAAAVAGLLGRLDAQNQSRLDLDLYEQIIVWANTADGVLDDLTDALSEAYEDSLLARLLPLDWLDDGGPEAARQREAFVDMFWTAIGRYLLGPHAELIELGDFIGDLIPEPQSQSPSSQGDAAPEITREQQQAPAKPSDAAKRTTPKAGESQMAPSGRPAAAEPPVRTTGSPSDDGSAPVVLPRVAPEVLKKPLPAVEAI